MSSLLRRLTAFVLKCFVQASPMIAIDETILDKAEAWLLLRRVPNGSFDEPGRVIHTDMQGGSAKGVGLAAYTVIALTEGRSEVEVCIGFLH